MTSSFRVSQSQHTYSSAASDAVSVHNFAGIGPKIPQN